MSIADALRELAAGLNEADELFAEDPQFSGGRTAAIASLNLIRSFLKGCFGAHVPMHALAELHTALLELELGVTSEMLRERRSSIRKSGVTPTSVHQLRLEGKIAGSTSFFKHDSQMRIGAAANRVAQISSVLGLTDAKGNEYDAVQIVSLRSNAMRPVRPSTSGTREDADLHSYFRHLLLPGHHNLRHGFYLSALNQLKRERSEKPKLDTGTLVEKFLKKHTRLYPRAFWARHPSSAHRVRPPRTPGQPRGGGSRKRKE